MSIASKFPNLPMLGHVRGKRSAVTCALKCDNACAAAVCNTSGNNYLRDIVSAGLSRRSMLVVGAVRAMTLLLDLRRFGAPSYPPGRAWDAPLERAAREGRFRVERDLNGAGQVICATGFRKGWEEEPLLAALVREHGVETHDRWLVLADDSTVPALTDATRTLALAGVQAQWAFPGADTLVGMKVAARGFARRVGTCRSR